MEEEFDMSTNKGRLDYAKKYFTIGTKVKSLYHPKNPILEIADDNFKYISNIATNIHVNSKYDERLAVVYFDGRWAEIINEVKEEKKMETQKLSRQGLKEIHSVACGGWKEILEKYGTTNPLEDYIELTQEQVNTMFNSSTKEQLPIVSKYLKQDDGSVDVTNFPLSGKGFCDGNFYIIRDSEWGEYKKQSFLLSQRYDWEIKTDNVGQLCLIPTKKK